VTLTWPTFRQQCFEHLLRTPCALLSLACLGVCCPTICFIIYRVAQKNQAGGNVLSVFMPLSLAPSDDLVAPYGLRGSNVLWFMCWFWRYINRLFVCLFNFLSYFLPSLLFSFLMLFSLLDYFLTYLSTPSRIDLFRFQAWGCRRRLNLALVFWVHFVL